MNPLDEESHPTVFEGTRLTPSGMRRFDRTVLLGGVVGPADGSEDATERRDRREAATPEEGNQAEEVQKPMGVETAFGDDLNDTEDWREILGREHLGAYPLVGHLGSGGMGHVYVGEDGRLGRRVAIKTLAPAMASRSSWLRRFEREARSLAALNHPNIVTIHSVEEDAGIHFLTMELVEGVTLDELFEDGGVSLDTLLRIGMDLTDALSAAHERGMVHRDLKPRNVMLTPTGRLKVLDFGIALTLDPEGGGAHDETAMIGTVSYMAPESLAGKPADTRSDLFAVGLLLYQLATGDHPFPGATPVMRASAILNEPTPSLREHRPDLPEEFERIVSRLLEKDPDARHASAADLFGELKALHEKQLKSRILDEESRSSGLHSVPPPAPWWRRPAIWVAYAAVAAIVAFAIWQGLPPEVEQPGSDPPTLSADAVDRVPIAVLEFRNLSGDPDQEWLSQGIAELVTTDLSQIPAFDLVKAADIRAAARDLGLESTSNLSEEDLRRLTDRLGVDAVLQGSFVRLSDEFRIAYGLEEPASGRVLAAQSLEGPVESGPFPLIDRLTSRVMATYEATRPDLSPPTIAEATTSSERAWQLYTEGLDLSEAGHSQEALKRYEKAVEIDPEFALAYVALSKLENGLGHITLAERYSERALELSARLPLADRFAAEAAHLSLKWATTGQAIETYSIAVRVYPGSTGWRNNLARRLAFFERYEEAIQHFRQLIDHGGDFWGNYSGAANALAALGDFESGEILLKERLESDPDHWWLRYCLAWHLTEAGKYDEADLAFDRMAAVDPPPTQLHYGRWRLAVMKRDWEAARRHVHELRRIDDPFAQWRSFVSEAKNNLYFGRLQSALSAFDKAIQASFGAERAQARCFKAQTLIAVGQYERALAEASEAQVDGEGQWPELSGIYYAAIAQQHLGNPDLADELVEELRERWLRQPNNVEERQIHHLSGLLALDRGNQQAALTHLSRAADLLPPHGVEFSWHVLPDHVQIWRALARVHYESGHPKQSIPLLQRLAKSGAEHLEQPIDFVRGHYLRAQALEALGRKSEARDSYRRFLTFWEAGEMDRDSVADAKLYLEQP